MSLERSLGHGGLCVPNIRFSLTLDEIAKSEGIVPSYVTRLFRLTLLAPDIVSAILTGKHPPELNARKLLDDTRLPLDWNEQRRSLEFA
jgi:site-specific DNA recombinase